MPTFTQFAAGAVALAGVGALCVNLAKRRKTSNAQALSRFKELRSGDILHEAKLLNLTPHAIRIVGEDDAPIMELVSAGEARVKPVSAETVTAISAYCYTNVSGAKWVKRLPVVHVWT